MAGKGFLLLLWVSAIHLAAIYLYTRGFLLSRLSLSETSSWNNSQAFAGSHKRAVLLVIDALRFDFISPDPPHPPSPYHHNVLRLPAELTEKHPDRSFVFTSFADPPTTTLQRIKGITTGSLPTFIDMGSNFGGSSNLEDSFIGQLTAAGKKIAFMGDDTWMTVYPDSFDTSFPYDSFNVEDLHTVDNGVIEHLFPLLRDESKPWDLLVGHFLGVDHVGHRVGPDHPVMKTKLEQMDRVLRDVVELLDDDTLLVLMGDHGMDRKGDHGGDTEMEVTAAMWFYSKGRSLLHPSAQIHERLIPYSLFPGANVSHRSIQQIDLVPTLSLLLGLPIPYNNLGSIIPELFWEDQEGRRFEEALKLNAAQVRDYLQTYRASPHGSELDDAWASLERIWNMSAQDIPTAHRIALDGYMRTVLSVCRYLWAQFNLGLIVTGLVLMVLSTLMTMGIWTTLERKEGWETWAGQFLQNGLYASGVAAAIGLFSVPWRTKLGMDVAQPVILSATLAAVISSLIRAPPKISITDLKSLPLPMILHAAAFASNSFVVWEDHVITFLLLSTIVPSIITGLAAPTSRFRYRILGFSALFAACIRLMAISTVCREEQQPNCHVTFYASASLTAPPPTILILSIPTALALPWIIRRFLRISQSDRGVAGLFLPYLLPAVLLQGSVAWLLEWAETTHTLESSWSGTLRTSRTLLGWGATLTTLFLGGLLWFIVPLCLQVSAKDSIVAPGAKEKKEVTVVGFANAFGSPYIIFWSVLFGLFYVTSQPTAQVVLGIAAIALLAYLEVVDSVRDVRALDAAFSSATPSSALNMDALPSGSASVSFAEITPLALLALHTYYATGHQSTISSIQWKAAFVLTPTLSYPISPLLVILNTFGPQFLFGMTAPLLALWNLAPLPHPASYEQARRESVRAALGMMLYHGTLLVGSAITAAWLRRHLMVWKIFAPKFMNAAGSLLAVDLGLLVGVGLGVSRITERVGLLFGGPAFASRKVD
ncbi:hypothetical protein BDY19DRAFT_909752 [Irpex rosettiformis]|uniref:Uncharacterized protein n=1 Tax=Irpex rosettiformis TaxID=378272 RepID=A0ACB8TR79_9APHY|nr:hypothetical protein BDY19DRAFT_909752 [Irpex rosettiformis]